MTRSPKPRDEARKPFPVTDADLDAPDGERIYSETAPAAPKEGTGGGRCVKHGDEMHSVHEYDPGTAARWALQNNIGRCTVEVGGATAGEAKP